MRRVLLCVLIATSWAARAQVADWPGLISKLETAQGAELNQLKQQIAAGGMAAHQALKDGAPATAPLREELRKAIRSQRDSAARAKGLVMHEWGAMGYAQGMSNAKSDSHAEETGDLPPFVQVWSQLAKQVVVPPPGLIIRKPLVYFYTDNPQSVTFSVACPHGMFTQWFPKASTVNPDPSNGGPAPAEDALIGFTGLLVWRNIDLLAGEAPALPKVPENAWWWPICRDTDSTPIKMGDVVEKFLFYRGIVSDVPPVMNVDGGAQKKYTLTNTRKGEAVEHLMLVHIDRGRAVSKYIPALAGGEKLTVDLTMPPDAKTVAEFAPSMRKQLMEHLEEAGLFPKEAAGMTQIWQKDWFETDGVRVIYLNPNGATASLMPMKITPAPDESVRTYLIAVECLKDSIDNVVKELIANLGDGKYAVREAAQRQLLQFGKRVQPALREARDKTEDEEVRNRINVILQRLEPRAIEVPDLGTPRGIR